MKLNLRSSELKSLRLTIVHWLHSLSSHVSGTCGWHLHQICPQVWHLYSGSQWGDIDDYRADLQSDVIHHPIVYCIRLCEERINSRCQLRSLVRPGPQSQGRKTGMSKYGSMIICWQWHKLYPGVPNKNPPFCSIIYFIFQGCIQVIKSAKCLCWNAW